MILYFKTKLIMNSISKKSIIRTEKGQEIYDKLSNTEKKMVDEIRKKLLQIQKVNNYINSK
tara:strand:- start:1630 stop:1812 length:183 start_codon:yes stop_codon:yes gene_type:complete